MATDRRVAGGPIFLPLYLGCEAISYRNMKLQNNAQHNTTIRKPFYEFYVPRKIMQHGPPV